METDHSSFLLLLRMAEKFLLSERREQPAINTTTDSVRNKDSPSDNDWLKLLRSDWFQNLSQNCLMTNFGQGYYFSLSLTIQ